MFEFINRRKKTKEAASRLYDTLIAQARQPVFYREAAVPDTEEGRFELLTMLAALVLKRLDGCPAFDAGRTGQALFDRIFKVLDCSLRESGVGDLSVPRHMKRMMQAFNGRVRAYDHAIKQAQDDELIEVLNRNLYGTVSGPDEGMFVAMVSYIRLCQASLESQPCESIAAGILSFPAFKTEEKLKRKAGAS